LALLEADVLLRLTATRPSTTPTTHGQCKNGAVHVHALRRFAHLSCTFQAGERQASHSLINPPRSCEP
jgi:hypothetical protein